MLELARSTASRGMNEKGAVRTADSLPISPCSFSSRITTVLAGAGEHSDTLQARVEEMAGLIDETHSLAGVG